ncbi:MAG: dihydrofolate reductase family protein [Acidobacteriota bacterium]
MGTLGVFNHVTVDGFFAGPRGEIDWFKAIRRDDEYEAYTHQDAQSGATLVFGRTTYQMMKSYWPTPAAIEADPGMARVVSASPKIVFSKTLPGVEEEPNWKNVTLLRDIERTDMLERKKKAGAGLVILGSGTIVQRLANLGLIDQYQLVIVPIVLGAGKPLFEGLEETSLELVDSRAFKNGIAVLTYRPASKVDRRKARAGKIRASRLRGRRSG